MKVEVLKKDKINDFVAYCKKHRMEIDESFLSDHDLSIFEPNEENPTYIITSSHEEVVATASLIVDDYNKRGKKARFRIFHSEIDNIQYYQKLLESILKHTEGLKKVYLFIPMTNKELIESMKELYFTVERFSFLLLREQNDTPIYQLPDDYQIRPFQEGRDEEIWCEIRNVGFAKLLGNETPITPDMVAEMISEEDYIEGGLMILYHKEKPVGIIRGSADEYEGTTVMNIGPLAILPEYQGKGLGRSLLRAALQIAKEKSYKGTVLVVNEENERAKALYFQEGFKQVEAVVCYKYEL